MWKVCAFQYFNDEYKKYFGRKYGDSLFIKVSWEGSLILTSPHNLNTVFTNSINSLAH